MAKPPSNQSPNSRPLKIGEAIRHALAEILLRGECHMPELVGTSITVSEVRTAPDLKNATVFVMPLGGAAKQETLDALIKAAPELRYLASKKVDLRYMPKLFFKLDTSFEEANRINELLNKTKDHS